MKASVLLLLKRTAQIIGVVALASGGWAGYLQLTGNFHPVADGIFRSAQLSETQLAAHIKENGIRTIVNLRGKNVGEAWYDGEMRAADAVHVQHFDFPLSAGREVTDAEIAGVLKVLETAPRPLLIHCQAGADRTGLISALYLVKIARRSPEDPCGQLSFRYGHFPWIRSMTAAMDRTFERIVSASKATAPAAAD